MRSNIGDAEKLFYFLYYYFALILILKVEFSPTCRVLSIVKIMFLKKISTLL